MKYLLLILSIITFTSQGQIIHNFELTNAVDGKTISLNNYSNSPGVIIIFTIQECPYSEYYLNRIKALSELYSRKIPVLLINSSSEANESVEEMAKYANRTKLQLPYLADKDQKVMSVLNPRKSPECFLLKNSNEKFSVVYHGAIDDNAQSAENVNRSYLQNAVEQLLAGKKIELPEMRPVGCSIQKN